MWSRKLLVWGVMLACLRYSSPRVLRGKKAKHRGLEVQRPAEVVPERESSRTPAPQVKTRPRAEPLSWRFPEDPVEPPKKLPVRFEPRQPDISNRVAVRCGESKVQVEVNQNLLGFGRLVEPEQVTLGNCSATDVDVWAHVIVFESELHGCGSSLKMTESALIYSFTLVYNPKVLKGSPIVRSQRMAVGVECHYPR